MLGTIVVGAAAGTLATVPMTLVMEALHRRLPGEPRRPLPPREITDAMTARAGAAGSVPERGIEALTLAGHFGYGALCGALFGSIVPRRPAAAVAAGTLCGLGIWAGSYLGWLPAARLRHHARHDPPARNALMMAAHVVWGATAGLMLGLRPRSGARRRLVEQDARRELP